MQALLILENGEKFFGTAFGAAGEAAGEIISYTSMVGYQEALTDPAHSGKLLIMTYPIAGSYGTNDLDMSSDKFCAGALIVKEYVDTPSNFRASKTLSNMMSEKGIVGISGIDTRALVKKLQGKGRMRAVVVCGDDADLDRAMASMQNASLDADFLSELGDDILVYPAKDEKYKVAVYDLGTKKSLIDHLCARGASLSVFPPKTAGSEIPGGGFDALVISGGAGNPFDIVENFGGELSALISCGLPVLAIDMGHLVCARLFGLDLVLMDRPHRGASCSVKDLRSNRVYPTQQSHAYAADMDSIDTKTSIVSFINQNDSTVEGISYPGKNIISVQFWPDDYPSEYGTGYVYEEFFAMLEVRSESKCH